MGKKIYSLICIEESQIEHFAIYTNYKKAKVQFFKVLHSFRRFLAKEDVIKAGENLAYIEDEFCVQVVEAETE